ncbi:hypothetical protein D918_04955, partial [Trichuris suis]
MPIIISASFLLRFICAGAFIFCVHCGTNVNRLRGIPLNSKFLYKEGEDFTCLDGSLTIAFDWVNDDYCDCPDGSDEPGTSACPRGSFHCPNLGAAAMNIPSSRVNDMICDCCDGSDEWAGHVKCPNLCEELGRRLKAEREQKVALHREGHATRLKMAEEAKKQKQEKQQALEKLEAQLSELSAPLEEAKGKMDEAVRLENEAKNAETAAWEEARKAEKEAERKKKAEAAFEDLDTNKDNMITIEELQARLEFDDNSDGIVTVEEAMAKSAFTFQFTLVYALFCRMCLATPVKLMRMCSLMKCGKELNTNISRPLLRAMSNKTPNRKHSTNRLIRTKVLQTIRNRILFLKGLLRSLKRLNLTQKMFCQ